MLEPHCQRAEKLQFFSPFIDILPHFSYNKSKNIHILGDKYEKIRNLSETGFLRLFFCLFSAAFLLAAVLMPDRARLFSGMREILSQPCKIPTNYFAVGGYSATFFNMGMVCLMCLGLYVAFRAELNAAATLAILLTTGFGSWGINIQNIWPTIWGTMLYCAVKKKPMKNYVSAMLFTTGIAPLITDLIIRHPFDTVVGYSARGFLVAVVVGVVSGFFIPAGLTHAPNVHKGYNLYNAALPVGMGAFMLQAILFNSTGIALPSVPPAETLKVAHCGQVRPGAGLFRGNAPFSAGNFRAPAPWRLLPLQRRPHRGLYLPDPDAHRGRADPHPGTETAEKGEEKSIICAALRL